MINDVKKGVTFEGDDVEMPLEMVADAFNLPIETALAELRAGRLTSTLERGSGEEEGRTRMTFFHGTKRIRFIVDAQGTVLHRSSVDFGEVSRRR